MLWQKLSIRVYLNVSQQSHPVVWHQPYSASLPHLPCKYKPDLLIITPPSTQRPSPSPPQESDSQSRLLSPAGGFQKSMWPQSWSSWGLPCKFCLANKKRCMGRNTPLLQEMLLSSNAARGRSGKRVLRTAECKDGKCQRSWGYHWVTNLTNMDCLPSLLPLDFLFCEKMVSYCLGHFHWGFFC